MASEGTSGDTGESGNLSGLVRSMGRKHRREAADSVSIPSNLVPVLGRCFICGTSPSTEDKAKKSGSEGA